jgi:hypothetical protein
MKNPLPNGNIWHLQAENNKTGRNQRVLMARLKLAQGPSYPQAASGPTDQIELTTKLTAIMELGLWLRELAFAHVLDGLKVVRRVRELPLSRDRPVRSNG